MTALAAVSEAELFRAAAEHTEAAQAAIDELKRRVEQRAVEGLSPAERRAAFYAVAGC